MTAPLRLLLAFWLCVAGAPAWAQQMAPEIMPEIKSETAAAGHGASDTPTPLSSALSEYEDLIQTLPDDTVPDASSGASAAATPQGAVPAIRRDAQGRILPSRRTPIRPSVQILQGNHISKRGTFRENGVTVYRGSLSDKPQETGNR